MKRVIQFGVFFCFGCFSTSLLGQEPRVRVQSVGNLLQQLGESDPEKVCAAAQALGKLRPTKAILSALEALLKNRHGRIKWTAAEALWRLEYQAADLVPVYAELLTARDADVRAASAWRLGRMGSVARHAVPMLAATLRDEDLEVRVQVGQALANLGAFAEPALPALVRALGDERLDGPGRNTGGWRSVRRSPALPALVALADVSIPSLIETFHKNATSHRVDPSSEPQGWVLPSRVAHAVPAFGERTVAPLVQALESKEATTRGYAALALVEFAQLNGLPKTAIEILEKRLDDPDEYVRSKVARALSWVQPTNTKAAMILREARGGFGPDNSERFADLERLSPHNDVALKVLLGMLDDKDVKTARETHRILAELELPADRVLEVWTKALSHTDPEVRSTAISALRKLGPRVKSAKSALRGRFAKEEDDSNRAGILDALTHIDPEDPALVPLLIESMEDPESNVRWSAIRTLADLGPKAKAAIPKIAAHLLNPREKDEDVFYVDTLVMAIVRIAPGSAESAGVLLKALRRQNIRSRLGPKSSWYMRDLLEDGLHANLPAAIPLLREGLKDKDSEVRHSVALVLVRAGLEIESALPILMEIMWSRSYSSYEKSRFQRRVVKLLTRRQQSVTPAVVAEWCQAWHVGDPEARDPLERGLLVLQLDALPHLLDHLRLARTSQTRRDLAHLLAQFEGQSTRVLPILREELRDPQPTAQYAAARALKTLGPDVAKAVPDLVRLLDNPHPGMRAVAAQALASIGRAAQPAVPALKTMLKEKDPVLCKVAAYALSRIDPDVSEALPILCDAFVIENTERRWDTETIRLPDEVGTIPVFPDSIDESIARFGERGVLALASLLDDADLDEWSIDNLSAQCGSHVRIRAALVLARLGPEAKSAVPALVRALDDRDPFVRDTAASALGRIGPDAKQAAPELIGLLEQQNRFVFGAGAWSSGSRSEDHRTLSSPLRYGGPFNVRSAGRQSALARIYVSGYGNYDPYTDMRPSYPYDPISVLSRIDTEARSSLPLLREIAKKPNHPRRLSAALALWRSEGEATDLISAFAAVLETHAKISKYESVPLTPEMRECLTELDTELKPMVRILVEWLERRQTLAETEDLVAVVEALGRLGPDAQLAVDVLSPMLQGDRWDAKRRVAASLALFRIRGEKDLVFPVLREVVLGLEEPVPIYSRLDRTESARVRAVRTLGVLTEHGDERANALIVEMAKGDENVYVRVAALESLAKQEESNAVAMKGLCAMLRHSDPTVRTEVASVCGRLGKQARLSREALAVATEDSQLAVRQAAIEALALVG